MSQSYNMQQADYTDMGREELLAACFGMEAVLSLKEEQLENSNRQCEYIMSLYYEMEEELTTAKSQIMLLKKKLDHVMGILETDSTQYENGRWSELSQDDSKNTHEKHTDNDSDENCQTPNADKTSSRNETPEKQARLHSAGVDKSMLSEYGLDVAIDSSIRSSNNSSRASTVIHMGQTNTVHRVIAQSFDEPDIPDEELIDYDDDYEEETFCEDSNDDVSLNSEDATPSNRTPSTNQAADTPISINDACNNRTISLHTVSETPSKSYDYFTVDTADFVSTPRKRCKESKQTSDTRSVKHEAVDHAIPACGRSDSPTYKVQNPHRGDSTVFSKLGEKPNIEMQGNAKSFNQTYTKEDIGEVPTLIARSLTSENSPKERILSINIINKTYDTPLPSLDINHQEHLNTNNSHNGHLKENNIESELHLEDSGSNFKFFAEHFEDKTMDRAIQALFSADCEDLRSSPRVAARERRRQNMKEWKTSSQLISSTRGINMSNTWPGSVSDKDSQITVIENQGQHISHIPKRLSNESISRDDNFKMKNKGKSKSKSKLPHSSSHQDEIKVKPIPAPRELTRSKAHLYNNVIVNKTKCSVNDYSRDSLDG